MLLLLIVHVIVYVHTKNEMNLLIIIYGEDGGMI
jgi:hypothetical protein